MQEVVPSLVLQLEGTLCRLQRADERCAWLSDVQHVQDAVAFVFIMEVEGHVRLTAVAKVHKQEESVMHMVAVPDAPRATVTKLLERKADAKLIGRLRRIGKLECIISIFLFILAFLYKLFSNRDCKPRALRCTTTVTSVRTTARHCTTV